MNSLFKSRLSLILVLVAFILPVILAKLVLDNHWYQGGVTNKGVLINKPVNYSTLGMENPHKGLWQVIYMPPVNCNTQCQDRLYVIKQSHTALGKYRDRVTPVVMQSQAAMPETAQGMPAMAPSSAMESQLAGGEIVIVDPMGNLVMRYATVSGKDAQIAQGKDLLADLRKMLKLSRIG